MRKKKAESENTEEEGESFMIVKEDPMRQPSKTVKMLFG